MHYGERLRALREDRGLTQKQIAAIINSSPRTCGDYEAGNIKIPLRSILILAKFYNVSMDYICSVSNKKTEFPKEYDTMDYKEIIFALRMDGHFNQTQIAGLLHVDSTTYGKYELGVLNIPVYRLVKLAKYYNVGVDYICGLTDKRTEFPKK